MGAKEEKYEALTSEGTSTSSPGVHAVSCPVAPIRCVCSVRTWVSSRTNCDSVWSSRVIIMNRTESLWLLVETCRRILPTMTLRDGYVHRVDKAFELTVYGRTVRRPTVERNRPKPPLDRDSEANTRNYLVASCLDTRIVEKIILRVGPQAHLILFAVCGPD